MIGKRIKWLDTSRGLAFLMVIYYHLSTRSVGGIVPYFSPIFLTTFFFVSGYLTKSGIPFKKVFEQRTRTLLFPLVFFGFGGGIVVSLKDIEIHGIIALLEPLKGVFYQYGEHQTLWFIASLYVYSLVFHFVDVLSKSPKRLLAYSFLLIVLNQILIYVLECPMLPWKMNYCMWACAIMGIGKVYRSYEKEIDLKIMRWYIVLGFLILYFGLLWLTKDSIVFGGCANWANAILIPFSGLVCMLYVSKRIIVNNKVLLYIGSNTLVYFALHRQVLHVVENLFEKLPVVASVWINLLEVLLIALLLAIPAFLINKFIPQVTGKGWKLWR